MVAIEETPLYKEILQTGLERGLVQGRQEERQQMLQRIITLRFGSVPDDIPPRLTLRTDDELEALLEVVLNAESLDALRRHLDRTYSNQ